MKDKSIGARIRRYWRSTGLRTRIRALGSLAASAAFALYNGVAGLLYRAPWNASICVYYLLLAGIRGQLVYARHRQATLPRAERRRLERRACARSAGALLALNIALVAPVALMAQMERPVRMGLIPAIATAVYATWKITLAVIRYRGRNRGGSVLTAQLRTVGLVDALVSILTLQNTLIMVNGDDGGRSMLSLAAWTSGAIFAGIVAISVWNWKQRSVSI